jgi:hypothetical protein
MKTILTSLFLLCATISFAQFDSTLTLRPRVTGYISAGLSLTNIPEYSDFLTSSYVSVEGGVMYSNFGAGLAFGRGNLKGIGEGDNINNYFLEGKVSYTQPLKFISGVVFLGYGGYVGTKDMFIEYGLGLTYSYKHMGFGVSYSNWDGGNYLTPSVSYYF